MNDDYDPDVLTDDDKNFSYDELFAEMEQKGES